MRRRVAAAAGRRRTRAFVHLKVNTDLNRLGVEPEELSGAVERLLRDGGNLVGRDLSHLAAAEEIDSPYTMHQLGAFERALREAKPLLDRSGLAPNSTYRRVGSRDVVAANALGHGPLRYRALRIDAVAANAALR